MSRIHLKQNHELSDDTLTQVQAVEAAGGDTSIMRGFAHRQDLFDGFFKWYGQARKGEAVEEELIELVRLKIARLNDCYT
jgi:hypothetical protein